MPHKQTGITEPSDFEKFDVVVRRMLSVSHEEIQKRDKEWRRKRAKKKRAKSSTAKNREKSIPPQK
jgi:U3 small nucleolar ribonucleoprotein component